jgi:predicted metal-dependent phosphoesterase TrpH
MEALNDAAPTDFRWHKADLHLHSSEDPKDELDHSALELLHRAHRLGFTVLAITLHDHALLKPELYAEADRLGILLIPGAEMHIEGVDVILLNLTEQELRSVRTFEDLKTLRESRGDSLFVIAPHPFFIFGGSMGNRLKEQLSCFDAIEYSHFHTGMLNLNESAVKIAEINEIPLLATSDTHLLEFFGDHYSLIQAPASPVAEEIFAAIRLGRLKRVSPPRPLGQFVYYVLYLLVTHPLKKLLAQAQGK